MTSDLQDDRLNFAAEDPVGGANEPVACWNVLVVDDDDDVHRATRLGLSGIEICARPLKLFHAYSGAEALEMLKQTPDIAAILLDVVMESTDAGLAVVARIRGELGLRKPRIIIRTGQPGYAPEIDAIRDYDINDYRAKGELTRNRLITSLTTAIRSYAQICQLDNSRRGLEQIVDASHRLITNEGMDRFADAVIDEVAGMFGGDGDGIVYGNDDAPGDAAAEELRVLGASGRFAEMRNRRLSDVEPVQLRDALQSAYRSARSQVADAGVDLFLPSRTGVNLAAHLAGGGALRDIDQRLVEVLAQNIAVCADNVRLVERLRHTAYVDNLLGIANKTALSDAIDELMSEAEPSAMRLVLIDIDQFSDFNETFGDRFGDALLRAVAERLQSIKPADAVLARVSNDTFALCGTHDAIDPSAIQRAVATPYHVQRVDIAITVRLGLVELPAHGRTGSEAIKNAYGALKRAKLGGPGSLATYSPEEAVEIRERTKLLQGLRSAFETDKLFLVYQPQLDLATGGVLGFETLMRWRADDGSYVPPDRFIPIAEQSGLIREMGVWALHVALRRGRQLHDAGWPDLRMAVNVSMSQVLAADFVDKLNNALHRERFPAQRLEIEITESIAMQQPDLVQRTLGQVRDMGISVAIDDFGTGFSSLSYLERLPVDRLKIDRAFVAPLGSQQHKARIAEMVIDLGRTLGLKVIAEGVETSAQRERLLALGCHEGQGYFFAKPLPADTLDDWLRQQQTSPPA